MPSGRSRCPVTDRTYVQAAEELNLPASWLESKAQKRQIPHRRYGRHVRFTDEDIAAIRAMHSAAPLQVPSRNVVAMRRRAG